MCVCGSSVYLRILGQPFYPIFPHFSQFFQARTTFQILLKILNNTFRYIIQPFHRMIYSTYSSKSFQLNSISLKPFKVFGVFRVIHLTYSSKSFQLNSISLKPFKVFGVFRVIHLTYISKSFQLNSIS